MHRLLRVGFTALLTALLLSSGKAHADEDDFDEGPVAEPGAQVDDATFHERLAPYGRWVDDGEYGEVWVPEVASGWQPYVDGRWVLTEYGWTWVSNDPFGWATWHYGNWAVRPGIGWFWVPGRVWAPAWVTWRYGGGYACWAPTPPRQFGRDYYDYGSPAWVVVPEQHFTQPILQVRVRAQAVIIQSAAPLAGPVRAGAVMVNPGPRPSFIARAIGQPVRRISAEAVVGRGTRAISAAPPAPASPAHVAEALRQSGWWPAAHGPAAQQPSPRPAQQPRSSPAAQPGPRYNEPRANQPRANQPGVSEPRSRPSGPVRSAPFPPPPEGPHPTRTAPPPAPHAGPRARPQ